jgi:hypothetical protein
MPKKQMQQQYHKANSSTRSNYKELTNSLPSSNRPIHNLNVNLQIWCMPDEERN